MGKIIELDNELSLDHLHITIYNQYVTIIISLFIIITIGEDPSLIIITLMIITLMMMITTNSPSTPSSSHDQAGPEFSGKLASVDSAPARTQSNCFHPYVRQNV